VKLQDVRDDSPVLVDFRFLHDKEARDSTKWVPASDQEQLRNRILWLARDSGGTEDCARQLGKSSRMLEKYRARRESLTREKQRLLIEEEARVDELDGRVRAAVAEAFLEGNVYFRGQQIRPRETASAFGPALSGIATRVLPDLYPHFSEIAISPKELEQLLDKDLAGPSTKFMEGGLGILSLDAGKYVAACTGLYPTRIAQEIESNGGLSGQTLVATFVSSPYGYAPDLVKACCAGLLRGKKIRIRTEQGTDIKSHQDPGVRDLFSRDRDFRRAEFFPAAEGEISGKDRIAIRKLFEKYFQNDQEQEDEPIADTVFQQFPAYRDKLRKLEQKYADLPGRPELPPALQKLGRALEDCCRSRFVQQTVSEVKRNLDALRDGLEQLGVVGGELTQEAIDTVARAARVRDTELAQLRQFEQLAGLEDDAALVTTHLSADRPWRDAAHLAPALERISARYVEERTALIRTQSEAADAAVNAVKVRPTFAQLDADQAHRVLRPIRDVLIDTTAEAVSPSLVEMRDRFASRIQPAQEAADDKLDEELSQGPEEQQVVKVDLRLKGRELENRAQLDALLKEVEERLAPMLANGARVRIA